MHEYDVVVVGAGLAGLQCCRQLARADAGLRILLVDRKTRVDQHVHTTGIFVRRTLEDFDLPQAFLGRAIRNVTLYSPARRALELESPYDEFRVGRMGPLYVYMLRACEANGVEWSGATKYLGAEADPVGSVVRLETNGRVRLIRTRFLVAADGAQSRVARDLGLDQNSAWIVGVEDVYHNHPSDRIPTLHCFIDPVLAPGYLAWIAFDGEETHIGVGGYAARFDPARALQQFKASVAPRLSPLLAGTFVERRGGRIPVNGVLEKIVCARGLALGDAAGAVSPLTAGGLDPCMRLSTHAAQVISRYLSSENTDALRCYSGSDYRARFVSRLWMRAAISRLTNPVLIEAACLAMRLPGLKSIAWHVFFGRGSFPDASAAEPKLSARATHFSV